MTIVVVAAVLIRDGQVLITQRPAGSHLAGLWEFPGGKVEPDEDPQEALRRELREELGIETETGEIVQVTFHRYPSKSVLLLFYRSRLCEHSPAPERLGVADLAWKGAEQLDPRVFPPADVAVLEKVRALLACP